MFVNKQTISRIIKEHEELVKNCKNEKQRKNFESMLQSYKAIKYLFDNGD